LTVDTFYRAKITPPPDFDSSCVEFQDVEMSTPSPMKDLINPASASHNIFKEKETHCSSHPASGRPKITLLPCENEVEELTQEISFSNFHTHRVTTQYPGH
jgi:hypothetical protein